MYRLIEKHCKKIFKSPNRGVTLLELLVAISIMTLVIAAGIALTDTVKFNLHLSKQASVASALETSSKMLSSRVSHYIAPKWFWYEKTFQRPAGRLKSKASIMDAPKTLNIKNYSITLHNKGDTTPDIPRTSFNLELRRLEGDIDKTENGMIFSRCIQRNQLEKKWTLQEILDLKRYPFINEEGTRKKITVQCCRIPEGKSEPVCAGGKLVNKNARWRPRIFFVTRNSIKVYPQYSESIYITGAGFMGFFDAPKHPEKFDIISFTLKNDCLSARDKIGKNIDKCSKTPSAVVKTHVNSRSVFKTNFEDTGIIKLGN